MSRAGEAFAVMTIALRAQSRTFCLPALPRCAPCKCQRMCQVVRGRQVTVSDGSRGAAGGHRGTSGHLAGGALVVPAVALLAAGGAAAGFGRCPGRAVAKGSSLGPV